MLDVTPLLRLYARYRRSQLAAQKAAEVQEAQLLKLVRTAASTRFGRDHAFDEVRSVADYQKRVPLRSYEDFWQQYWQKSYPVLDNCTWPGKIPYFPLSSGTSSGTTKYIPCSHEMIRSNNKAGTDLLVHHVSNRPNSRLLGGKSFMLGGSTDLNLIAPGIYSGDLSGISVVAMPWWARMRYFPSADLALVKNWEEKIGKLSRLSMQEDIRMISGVPSWLLIFFNRLGELRPDAGMRLAKFYPNLEMVVHGGVNFAPYHKQFMELLEGSKAELREVYPASEGFIAVADRGYHEGLRMNLDHGLFFEFVPTSELGSPSPTRHWLGNVEKDVNYAIVLTTCAGLWSYIIGDTVKFVDLEQPRILVTGRTAYQLSAFGEHLISEEIEDSLSTAADQVGLTITDFCVGAVYPKSPGELGGHLYIIEFKNGAPDPQACTRLATLLDENLRRRNEDYEGHRAEGFGLKGPEIRAVGEGTFAAWMKSRNKLGGQNKVPRIVTSQDLFKDLQEFIAKEAG